MRSGRSRGNTNKNYNRRKESKEEDSFEMKLPEINPPLLANQKQPGLPSNSLYNGSRFRGYQKSRGNAFDVEIIFKNVDVQSSHICGYLTINGLTDDHPMITTFFEGEIISRKNPFLTRKWDADEEVDKKHWAKFSTFAPYTKSFNSDNFDYESLASSDNVFMRLKEQFFVYPENVKEIVGVSFAGFYYICFTNSDARMEGYYYHRGSEWSNTDHRYQSLTLSHVPEKSIEIYQFR